MELNKIDDGKGIKDELSFWRKVLMQYKTDPKSRPFLTAKLNPKTELQLDILRRIGLMDKEGGDVKVLDIGCGPASTIGKITRGFKVHITGLDPLTEQYHDLLAEFGHRCPHETITGVGEKVADYFPPATFDYIHVENSLDHCYDPSSVIRGLQKVAKPGAIIFIKVFVNEGEHNEYAGFHAWNFDLYNNKVIFWRP